MKIKDKRKKKNLYKKIGKIKMTTTKNKIYFLTIILTNVISKIKILFNLNRVKFRKSNKQI